MKISCGTDIIEISRIKQAIEELGESFLNRIYTKEEIHYCESKKAVKYQHYAARFAAKEAVYKAISPILSKDYHSLWKNIEVQKQTDGRPLVIINQIVLSNLVQIDLSLSHCKEYAVATVVIQYE